jgi:Trk K+ transport system NAD-binding subunit
LRIKEQIPVNPAEPVVVVGDGKLGLLIASVLQLSSKDVVLIGHHPEHASHHLVNGVHWVKESDASQFGKYPLVI